MKTVLIKVLAAFGLVPARRYAALSRQMEKRNRELWVCRKHVTAADGRVGQLERQLQQEGQRLKKTLAAADQHAVSTTRQDDEWKAMQTRLAETERALAIARDQLMAIEVKLDILEGAANVLDARTRVSVDQGIRQVIDQRR